MHAFQSGTSHEPSPRPRVLAAGGVEPTAASEALLARAHELLSALERVRSELGAFGLGMQGSVRVLASPPMLAERLPEHIGRFMAQYPSLNIGLDERTSPLKYLRALRLNGVRRDLRGSAAARQRGQRAAGRGALGLLAAGRAGGRLPAPVRRAAVADVEAAPLSRARRR